MTVECVALCLPSMNSTDDDGGTTKSSSPCKRDM